MSLDLNKLRNVSPQGDRTIAECPACAAQGKDATGDHLIIYADGRYGCVVHPKEKEHNQEIFRLAGCREQRRWGPVPVPVKRPACATAKPRVLMVLDWLTAPTALDAMSGEQTAPKVSRLPEAKKQAVEASGPADAAADGQPKARSHRNPFGCRTPSLWQGSL
jgi:hypothetical protein